MKRISWKENQTLWQELRTALSPNCLRLDCRQGSPVLPWVGTGQRRVPGAMTDKKLRGGLPNKQRPLSEPSACAKTLPLNLKGSCSRLEGKVKESLGEEMASQRLLAGKGAWGLLGPRASATARGSSPGVLTRRSRMGP